MMNVKKNFKGTGLRAQG